MWFQKPIFLVILLCQKFDQFARSWSDLFIFVYWWKRFTEFSCQCERVLHHLYHMLPSSAGLPSSIGVVGVGTIGYALGVVTIGFAESILVDSGMETVQNQYVSLFVPPHWHMLECRYFWQLTIQFYVVVRCLPVSVRRPSSSQEPLIMVLYLVQQV